MPRQDYMAQALSLKKTQDVVAEVHDYRYIKRMVWKQMILLQHWQKEALKMDIKFSA